MLELLGILGYSMIGFGLGGITIRKIKNKEINKNFKEFNKFQAEAENEIKQKDKVKEDYVLKAQEVIKENTELAKSNNRSLREVELLQTQLNMALQKLEFLTGGGLERELAKEVKEKETKEKLAAKELKAIETKVKKEAKAKMVKEEKEAKLKAKEDAKIKNNTKVAEELKAKIETKSKLKGNVAK